MDASPPASEGGGGLDGAGDAPASRDDAAADAIADVTSAPSDGAADAGGGSDAADASATPLASIFVSIAVMAGPNPAGVVMGFPSTGGCFTQYIVSKQTIARALGVGVDGSGYIYVADSEQTAANNAVQVFAPDANGLVAPVRVITGPSTHLNSGVYGLHVTQDGHVYVAGGGTIALFAPGADGDATPTQYVQGTDPSGTWMPTASGAIGVDATNQALYLYGLGADFAIAAFPYNATGTTPASRVLTGNLASNPQLVDQASGLWVGSDGTLFVANSGTSYVGEWAPTANGMDPPKNSFRTVSPPSGITLDSTGRIYTVEQDGNVRVYDAAATGSPAPTPLLTIPGVTAQASAVATTL
jgi:hypothetical protein